MLYVNALPVGIPSETIINLTEIGRNVVVATTANAGADQITITGGAGVIVPVGTTGYTVGLPIYTTATKQTVNRVKRRTFGDGYVQTAPDGINPAKVIWNVSWVGISKDYGNYLENILNITISTSSQFIQWQAPDESVETEWLLDGAIQREFLTTSLGISNISCTLVRYFSL